MLLFNFKSKNQKNDFEKFKPYYIVNGTLTKENHPFCCLWEDYVPFFNGLEEGIDKRKFKQIVKREHLNNIPDGDGYGSYRKIVFSEREMISQAWTMAIFPCSVVIDNGSQTLFAVTGTGERGSEGARCYFEEEEKALAYLCAILRYMKSEQ